jgi:hypothetical protein
MKGGGLVNAQLGRPHGLGQDLGLQEAEQQAVQLGTEPSATGTCAKNAATSSAKPATSRS